LLSNTLLAKAHTTAGVLTAITKHTIQNCQLTAVTVTTYRVSQNKTHIQDRLSCAN